MTARLLIVEDNADNLKLMSYLLRSFGYQVLSAQDGEEGLAIVASEALDLIICDIQMPGIDGYEFARQLKADPRSDKIPLIAVTALAMVGDRDKVLAAGFDGYITKPIVPRAFVNQVETFLGQELTKPHAQCAPAAVLAAAAMPKKGVVLVVDNTPMHVELARKTLEPFGFEVMGAATIQEALALARTTTPDLILSDLHLAHETGYDLIRVVKADPKLRQIPYVFISSITFHDSERSHGLALGADKFLARPISPQKLLAEIEQCLAHRKEQ
jgi:two-component system cell cycle response regulator